VKMLLAPASRSVYSSPNCHTPRYRAKGSLAIACTLTCSYFVAAIGKEIWLISPVPALRLWHEMVTWSLPWAASKQTAVQEVLCLHHVHNKMVVVVVAAGAAAGVVALPAGGSDDTAFPNAVVLDDSCSNSVARSSNCFVDSTSNHHSLMVEDCCVDIRMDTWESDLATMVLSDIRHCFVMASFWKNTDRSSRAAEVEFFGDDLMMPVACAQSSDPQVLETLLHLLVEIRPQRNSVRTEDPPGQYLHSNPVDRSLLRFVRPWRAVGVLVEDADIDRSV
jgi:hypothetical protein